MKRVLLLFFLLPLMAQSASSTPIELSAKAQEVLKGRKMIYIERNQYPHDHHNTATIFQKGEYNEASFATVVGEVGSFMRVYDFDKKISTTLIECPKGIVRDPELSFDGKRVIFSMRHDNDDSYHIYEMNVDGSALKQLTTASGVSDIDPLYLPDGGIVFSSTRQPKYCMCNRHIMCNLFRMDGDGSNITQIGVSTLFEGHSTLLPDGRILYDRWEYVDRNFANAQALWTVNPDGTKHSIYYGNNTSDPDGVIDARPIPGTDLVACIFGSCHDRPWGALTIIDRKRGVDGADPVVQMWPEEARDLIDSQPTKNDTFRFIAENYEDPYPLDETYILVSRTIQKEKPMRTESKTALYLIGRDGTEEMILEGELGLFDPMPIETREKPKVLPEMRNYSDSVGQFYVQNVYEGTHMEGVEKGAVKYLRVVESLNKRTYTLDTWGGEGVQAPGVSWHNFEVKRIVSEVEVKEDGSANFEAPAGKHLYFQLLDRDKKMIQTMRSGVSLMPGEINGCVGCHENRLAVPANRSTMPLALREPATKITGWMDYDNQQAISFLEMVQPILDRHCVKCHDFDPENRDKMVLARDKTPYFNAAYTDLYVKKAVDLIGAGPSEFQAPYSWGSYTSKIARFIDRGHHGSRVPYRDRQIIYAWLDLNGGYYPTYESASFTNHAGRSPFTIEETRHLYDLLGLDYKKMVHFSRTYQAQISFDRPEVSPALDAVRDDEAKYNEALEMIRMGAKRLEERPRGDIESELVICEEHKIQLQRYVERMESVNQNTCNIDPSEHRRDAK